MTILAEPIELDVLRLRSEFLEMPGLIVTVEQVARLFSIRLAHAAHLLDALQHEGFLIRDACGTYQRPHR